MDENIKNAEKPQNGKNNGGNSRNNRNRNYNGKNSSKGSKPYYMKNTQSSDGKPRQSESSGNAQKPRNNNQGGGSGKNSSRGYNNRNKNYVKPRPAEGSEISENIESNNAQTTRGNQNNQSKQSNRNNENRNRNRNHNRNNGYKKSVTDNTNRTGESAGNTSSDNETTKTQRYDRPRNTSSDGETTKTQRYDRPKRNNNGSSEYGKKQNNQKKPLTEKTEEHSRSVSHENTDNSPKQNKAKGKKPKAAAENASLADVDSKTMQVQGERKRSNRNKPTPEAAEAAEAESSVKVKKEPSAEESGKSRKRNTAKKATAEKDSKKSKEAALNRKKSDAKFWVRFFSLTAIVPVYLALVVCMAVLPRSTVSLIEKRNLSTFPEFSWSDYWSGDYTASIAHYFDDTVPFRDTLKQAGSRLLNLTGIQYNNVQVSGQMQVVNNTNDTVKNNTESVSSNSGNLPSVQTADKKTDEEEDVTPKGQEIADGVYTNGTIVVYQDNHYRGMTMYGGGSGDAYIDALNNFANDLRGVKVYSMIDPTSSEFYTPKNFMDYNASQSDDIERINSRLDGVTGINVCSTLAKHINEPIYTRTDHHWMSLGAYYAAECFAKEAGVTFKDIRDYEKKTRPGYVGTLYSFSDNNANLLNDPEDFIYYEPKVKNYSVDYYDYGYNYICEGFLLNENVPDSELYCTYISGDIYTVKIKTEVKNGRKLCLVKDSYGNALVPFLAGSFEEVYVVDMRYFEVNLVDFVKDKGITDLLFSCCSYSAVGPNADNLEVLRTMGGYVASDDSSDDANTEPLGNDDNTQDNNSNADDTSSEENDNDFTPVADYDDGQLGLVGNIYDGDEDNYADDVYDDYKEY